MAILIAHVLLMLNDCIPKRKKRKKTYIHLFPWSVSLRKLAYILIICFSD